MRGFEAVKVSEIFTFRILIQATLSAELIAANENISLGLKQKM
jgi:hypothetical protein